MALLKAVPFNRVGLKGPSIHGVLRSEEVLRESSRNAAVRLFRQVLHASRLSQRQADSPWLFLSACWSPAVYDVTHKQNCTTANTGALSISVSSGATPMRVCHRFETQAPYGTVHSAQERNTGAFHRGRAQREKGRVHGTPQLRGNARSRDTWRNCFLPGRGSRMAEDRAVTGHHTGQQDRATQARRSRTLILTVQHRRSSRPRRSAHLCTAGTNSRPNPRSSCRACS